MIEITPNFAIGYYVSILIGYLVYKVVISPDDVTPLIGGLFVAVILVGEFMISVGMTKTVCGFEQWGFSAMATFVPWILIAGMIKFILMIRPGWLVPFSNTIGYFLSSAIFSLSDTFKKLLVPNTNLSAADTAATSSTETPGTPGTPGTPDNGKEVSKALQEIYEDESLLINQMTPENVMDMITKFTTVGIMLTPASFAKAYPGPNSAEIYNGFITNLKKAVYFKLYISEFIWLLLSGILVISITFNYIVSYGCKMTAEQIEKKQAKMAALSAASADAAANEPSTVSKSTD
jgi:hypothetical protein